MPRSNSPDPQGTLSEMYAEYRQLRRNVAVKRLERLEKAGFESSDVFRQYGWIRNRPAGKIAPSEIRQALMDIRRFVTEEPSTVKELRAGYEAASQRLAESGYDIPASDLANFRRFMSGVTSRHGARIESASAADMYSEMRGRGLLNSERNRQEVLAHFNWYKNHMDEIEEAAEEMRGARGGVSLADVRRSLER